MRVGGHLFYGDNLGVLREHIATDSVDLIYLDPPFNSNANYNILFRSPTGEQSNAQIEAFEDTWHWNDKAEDAFDQVARSGNTKAFDLLNAMRGFLGENDMMAYLSMMAIRLIELHRVLKPTGSLYLHCDPTASHYLKLLLDGVFGPKNYVNEIIWRRYGAHNDVGQGSKHYGRVHDGLLFYSKTSSRYWNQLFTPLDPAYVSEAYNNDDGDGRLYTTTPLTAPGGADKGNPVFEWNGHTRAWRYNMDTMQKLHDEGRLRYSRTGYVRQKLYLDDARGVPVQDLWCDISALVGSNAERLGYPTQKPVALLERIIAASCPEGGVVLDPFCGCGTAVHAAQRLGRRWAGIDVTHLAISLIEKRMRAAFPDIELHVEGTPRDLAAAEDLAARDKYQFQWWVVAVLDAMPFGGKKKGADGGVDGILYFRPEGKKVEKALVSVKGGANVGVGMIRDLHSAMMRDKAPIGIFVARTPPTAKMESEAASVGRFHSETTGRSYAKLQIISLEELFQGKRPDLPFIDPHAAFRTAPRETRGRQEQLL